MRTVWRIAIAYNEEVKKEFNLPERAEVLAIKAERMPNSVVNIWVAVDDEAPLEKRIFELIGTGQKVPDGGTYWGTAVEEPRNIPGYLGPRLVLHLYEVLS